MAYSKKKEELRSMVFHLLSILSFQSQPSPRLLISFSFLLLPLSNQTSPKNKLIAILSDFKVKQKKDIRVIRKPIS